MSHYSLAELCALLHSPPPLILTLQKSLGLPIPSKAQGYSEPYLNFLKKVLALRAFFVPLPEIQELFETEKKVLLLLHVDSLSSSPTWYLDYCTLPEPAPDCLLLTGYKPGFALDTHAVQHTLDFGTPAQELFKGGEMGEDVRLVLKKYGALATAVKDKVDREKPRVAYALEWSKVLAKRAH